MGSLYKLAEVESFLQKIFTLCKEAKEARALTAEEICIQNTCCEALGHPEGCLCENEN